MLRIVSIACHAALLALFIYLQSQGDSIFGSDESRTRHSNSTHSNSHK